MLQRLEVSSGGDGINYSSGTISLDNTYNAQFSKMTIINSTSSESGVLELKEASDNGNNFDSPKSTN